MNLSTSTKITIGLLSAAVLGFGGYKLYTSSRRSDELDKLISDPNAQLASQFRSVLDTMFFTSKDTDRAVELAYKVSDWNKVQESYSKLYNRSLVADLQSKMGADEYRRFLTALSGSKVVNDIKANTTKVTTVNNPPSSPVRAGANVRVKKSQALPLNLYNTPEDAMAVTKVGNEYKPDPRPNGVIRTHTTAAFAKVITTKLYTFTPVGKSPVNVVFAQIQFLATPSIVRWINAAALETVSTGVKGLGCADCGGKCGMGCSCNAMPVKQLNGIHIA